MLAKVISGFFVALIIVLAEWFSPFIWFVAVCLLSVYGNFELQKLIEGKKYRHNYFLITSLMLVLLTSTYFMANSANNGSLSEQLIFPNNDSLDISFWKSEINQRVISAQNLIFGISFLILTIINLTYVPRVSIGSVSFSIMRFIYLGYFPSYIILLRAMPKGGQYLLLILVAGAFCDILAYFSGKAFGKTHLLPEISPNKTIAGSIGGTLGCIMVTFTGGTFLIGLPWFHTIILGLITAIISQMGDLIESLFKRDAGVKDSGNIIPGHGGILDRVDSYIFISFSTYFYLLYVVL